MERDGRKIGTDADKLRKRRLADGRNALRKMSDDQRAELFAFAVAEGMAPLRRAALADAD